MKKSKSLIILAIILIIAGIIITLDNYSITKNLSKQWPILVLITGIGFSLLFFEKKRTDQAIIFISSFLILSSIFFYYLNYTSWKTLSYLWPFFLGIAGLSFLSTGILTKKRIFIYLSVIFIALFIALFIVFTIALKLWPISLIVFGISLLIIEYFNRK